MRSMQIRFEADVLEPVDVRPGKFFGQGNFPQFASAFAASLFHKTARRRMDKSSRR
jgi:hypothetical protein